MALSNVGPMLEQDSGPARLLAVYAISAVTGFAASCLQPYHSQGSSGILSFSVPPLD